MTAQQAREALYFVPSEMPVFVLLGSDPFAAGTIAEWVGMATAHGGVNTAKILSALKVAAEMEAYNFRKVPD